MALYHDSPGLTNDEMLRVTIALSVPEGTEVSGDVGTMRLEGGKYACAEFTLGPEDYGEAWQWIYTSWLPVSGYLPEDKPAFELFPHQEPAEGKHTVNICIPVRPAE